MLPSVVALLPTPTAVDSHGSRNATAERPGGGTANASTTLTDAVWLLPTPTASRYGNNQSPSPGGAVRPSLDSLAPELAVDWGKYEPAIRRHERLLGRPVPPPTITGQRGGKKLNPALSEWMMGWPDGWVTQVPGISVNDQLRLAGNGVVPQQCAAALRWLLPRIAEAGEAA